MKHLWVVIAAVLLASCQSGGSSAGAAGKSRDDAERDRKINSVQEQIRNMNH